MSIQTGISLQKPPSATIFEQLSWPLNFQSDTDFTIIDAVAQWLGDQRLRAANA